MMLGGDERKAPRPEYGPLHALLNIERIPPTQNPQRRTHNPQPSTQDPPLRIVRIVLQLSVQRAAADVEKLGGLSFVAVDRAEHVLDVALLNLVERRQGRGIRQKRVESVGRRRGASVLMRADASGKVRHVDGRAR